MIREVEQQTGAWCAGLGLMLGAVVSGDWHDAQCTHSSMTSCEREVARNRKNLKRNRRARERSAALRSLGMVRTPYGWE